MMVVGVRVGTEEAEWWWVFGWVGAVCEGVGGCVDCHLKLLALSLAR